MSEIRVRENESLESALRRFKRQCARSGVIAEVRKREHYEKPSVKRKKKAEAARKRKYLFKKMSPIEKMGLFVSTNRKQAVPDAASFLFVHMRV